MLLFVLAYLGGALTIVSPCILPVLPFVFARADKPFIKSGLPLLLGMALTFAGVASLAAVGGGWAVQANGIGRIVALVVLAFFGLLLLFPALADRATRPLVALGSRLSERASGDEARSPAGASFLLGVATGLLWAPCAGPILGLVLTGAALQGASVQTSLLLLAYAAGAATSLALALLVGGRVFAAMKRSLGASEWVRRALGVVVLGAVAAIALGVDTGFLTRVSLASTSKLEQGLVDRVRATKTAAPEGALAAGPLPVEGPMPPLTGAVAWLNSPPLTAEQLRGKVVVVDFWTYSCINCLRSLPYVEAWVKTYAAQGLVVIGVHTPEFAFEGDVGNVRKAVRDLGVTYPVAVDNDRAIWRAFNNNYWPAHYFIDGQGRVRAHHFGEGEYDRSEEIIRRLLAENGAKGLPNGLVKVQASGATAAADLTEMQSPETYLGYAKASGNINRDGLVGDKRVTYAGVEPSSLSRWSLDGVWTVGPEAAVGNAPHGVIAYRFLGRDLHLVLGPGQDGKPTRFRVTMDGKPPGEDHGADIDAAGAGVVTGHRLYQPGPPERRLAATHLRDRVPRSWANSGPRLHLWPTRGAPDLGGDGLGLGEERRIDGQPRGRGVLLQLFGPARADDSRGDIGLAQHPGQRELRQRTAGVLGQGLQLLHCLQDRRFQPGLHGIAHGIAGAAAVGRQGRAGPVLAGEHALGQGRPDDLRDAVGRRDRDHPGLGTAPQQGILRLAGDELLDARNGEGRLDLVRRPFGEADPAHLAGADDLAQRLHGLFQRRLRVVAVALVEVDIVGA